ncbi:MAG: hypothetical protein IH840_13010 [Candidatus Heimdallarchaeota archaeon]|nr:hypothetical protein [Candidatus Heimdallarchaeota archaeon]
MAGIFKNNDIRGTYPIQLDEEIAFKIGYLFGLRLPSSAKVIIVGDSRLSTPVIKKYLTIGLIEANCIVLDAGMGPTPLTYFGAKMDKSILAGIMITASHNPKDDNGIKICNEEGESYHYDNLYHDIELSLDNTPELKHLLDETKLIDAVNIRKNYFDFLISKITISNSLTVAVEFGNGATRDFGDIITELSCNLLPSRQAPDGNFPTILPDPTKAVTFARIKEIAVNKKIDLGIAFDGDGDRVGFLTPKGHIISPDKITMMLASSLMEKFGSVSVLIDVKISNATAEYIQSLGGVVDLTQVGHSWVHENLVQSNFDLAAELSGHYYFNKGYLGFDDGLYTALVFLELVDTLISKNIDLDDFVTNLPQYASTEEFRISMPNSQQDVILERLKLLVAKENGKLIDIDGVRGEFSKGWFIARKSGTEEALSYRIEGFTQKDLAELKLKVEELIQ